MIQIKSNKDYTMMSGKNVIALKDYGFHNNSCYIVSPDILNIPEGIVGLVIPSPALTNDRRFKLVFEPLHGTTRIRGQIISTPKGYESAFIQKGTVLGELKFIETKEMELEFIYEEEISDEIQ